MGIKIYAVLCIMYYEITMLEKVIPTINITDGEAIEVIEPLKL